MIDKVDTKELRGIADGIVKVFPKRNDEQPDDSAIIHSAADELDALHARVKDMALKLNKANWDAIDDAEEIVSKNKRVAELEAQLAEARGLIKRHEDALEWVFEKSRGGLPILLRKIEREVQGIEFSVDKYTQFGIQNVSGFHKTPLAAIEAASKEKSNAS